MNYRRSFQLLFLLALFSMNLQSIGKKAQTPLQIDEYLKFIQAYDECLGPVGDYTKGEIEIITDPKKISEVQDQYKKKLLKSGISLEEAERWSQVGLIEGDSRWLWIRDAVILPSGRTTIKGRLNWKRSIDGPQGVAMLPIREDKMIIFCLKYKHTLRSWQLELPRGARSYGESAESASKRELRNETGFVSEKQIFLGSVAASSSNFNTLTPIFLNYVTEQKQPGNVDQRAILGFLVLSKDEIKEAFSKGYIKLKIHGEIQKVAINDANIAFALMQAEIRGLI